MNGTREWGRWHTQEKSFDQGGQGQVYRVLDSTGAIEGTFVLKELKNPKRQTRFENEIRSIASLDRHPNVIHLVDSGIYGNKDKPYYVMPEADGGSLAKAVIRGPHDVARILELFENILQGVEHIHAGGIIHRDIKPENILMFAGVPRISDMGLALLLTEPRVTPTYEAVGPRYYMAPELEDGRQLNVTPRADIYSLGKVLYFMLSRGKMFAREKYQLPEWRLSKLYDDERYEHFALLFRNTITVSPRDRYSSIEDLQADLREVASRFAAHPGTTLRNKVPSIEVDLIAPANILGKLDPKEWVELLNLRHRRAATFSPELFAAARVAMQPAFAGALAIEVLRCAGEMDHANVVDLCAEIVKVGTIESDGFFQLSDNWSRVQLLALESHDPAVASIIGEDASVSPQVLEELIKQYDLLNTQARESVVTGLVAKDLKGQEQFLLDLSRSVDLTKTMLAMVVAGLMRAATESTLDRVAELLHSSADSDTLNAIVEGIAFKGTGSLNALLKRGGYSERAIAMLSILAKASETRTSTDAEE